MSSSIGPHRPTPAASKIPPVPPPQAVEAAPRPAAGDRLRLSASHQALEDLQAQLAGPLPALPERAVAETWQQADQANRTALIAALRGDEAVSNGLAAWQQLPQGLKLQLGERISAIQAEAYGFRPVTLRIEAGPYRGGFHPANGGEVTIGPKALVSASEFLNTVVHEQTHAMQWEKGEALVRGRLDSADPYGAVAAGWLDNFYDYASPSAGYKVYRSQPIEAHAFATGDAVAAAVMARD